MQYHLYARLRQLQFFGPLIMWCPLQSGIMPASNGFTDIESTPQELSLFYHLSPLKLLNLCFAFFIFLKIEVDFVSA